MLPSQSSHSATPVGRSGRSRDKHRAGVEDDGVGWEALFMLSGGCEASQLLVAHHAVTRRVFSSLPSAYFLEAMHTVVSSGIFMFTSGPRGHFHSQDVHRDL